MYRLFANTGQPDTICMVVSSFELHNLQLALFLLRPHIFSPIGHQNLFLSSTNKALSFEYSVNRE